VKRWIQIALLLGMVTVFDDDSDYDAGSESSVVLTESHTAQDAAIRTKERDLSSFRAAGYLGTGHHSAGRRSTVEIFQLFP
jgi:hypothetical protein